VKKREIRALVKAGRQLNCDDLAVITYDFEATEEHESKQIRFLPIWIWMLG